jgi:uncharacterized protein (DUF488 family)
MPQRFYTVGYEATTQAGFIAGLQSHGVKTLIDVRDVANSRRAGFSKKLLAASLDEAGIVYLHLRALGTPKAGRIASRAGRREEFEAIYEQAFLRPEAQLALREAADICRATPTALMCFCADGRACHRHRIKAALDTMGLDGVEIGFRTD